MAKIDKVLRLKQVLDLTGQCRSVLYQEMKAGRFPRPVLIGRRSVGWLEGDLARWQRSRLRSMGRTAKVEEAPVEAA